ncbi:hypothetical protein [Archangium sp. Cb G35]|uniref:hypothetical protein n=1 Tax=Archangium sp. Cb G35 TaxID=1920190 RepID=UPI000B168079|nr:hypothetical protein [Archangium sp. Cb G35]
MRQPGFEQAHGQAFFDMAYLLLHQMLKTPAAPRMDIARRLTSGMRRPVAA